MEQFEQLLTCAICLDRYRNPKLLPCQHSFCMEPCMDGLVDYVRRQVKCPECRAEHRIPYQGVQGYPTNVTLQRFLELHIEITGELPDPTSGQVMKRCGVCSEKAYCCHCMHCDKDVCPDCKAAHMDILRREISRINNQVRRALHRLQDMLGVVEKNMLALQTNCSSVSEEVDEIYRRLTKALKDRTEYLRGEVDRYLSTELRNLDTLKQNLEQEISNIGANCDLADKHMQSDGVLVEWDDQELMDAKEIFLKTVDFIRNFECDTTTDYNRRVRFVMAHDPNQLVMHLAGYGELSINMPHQPFVNMGGTANPSNNMLQPPGPGLMRSKSDHRLAQYRQQEERGCYEGVEPGTVSPLGGRKFGERYAQRGGTGGGGGGAGDRYGEGGGGRYGRGGDYGGDYGDTGYDADSSRTSARSRLRSRFGRHGGTDQDSDNDTTTSGGRSVRFSETNPQPPAQRERERVLDTEDASKGPLSGITRLYDSPRVMKRIQESQQPKKEPTTTQQPPNAQQQQKQQPAKKTPPGAQRQVSEEDEITKIKRLMKNAPGEPRDSSAATIPERPGQERVTALKRGGGGGGGGGSGTDEESERGGSGGGGGGRTSSNEQRKTPQEQTASSEEEEEEEDDVSALQQQQQRKTPSTPTRSTPVSSTPASRKSSVSSETSSTAARQQTVTSSQKPAAATSSKEEEEEDDEEEEESETSSESEETDSEEESANDAKPSSTSSSTAASSTATTSSAKPMSPMEKTDIGPLLARSAQARDTGGGGGGGSSTRRNSRDDNYSSRYGTSDYPSSTNSYLNRTRSGEEPEVAATGTGSRYGSTGSGFTSRFLNKSKSTAAVSPEDEEPPRRFSTAGNTAEDGRYPTSARARFAALKERKSRLARSKSSHSFGGTGDDDDDDVTGGTEDPSLQSPSAYYASKYGSQASGQASSGGSELARSRSTHALKSRESSPERSTGSTSQPGGPNEKDGAALSSWARYLKNKYGNRGSGGVGGKSEGSGGREGGSASSLSGGGGSSSNASRRLSLGLPLRSGGSIDNSDDDQKNLSGSPSSPIQGIVPPAGFAAAGTSPSSVYLAKRRQLFSVGARGSEAGCFTWPRGIAVAPDNHIVVADSSNHRVQVFDSNGIFQKEFGQYGNGEGEFDCLAGVAVNRIGQFIIADRYNHRIQVFDPAGRFLRTFGSQGTADGRFNYPWGITTDALGFIYVCDKENHRVQVFQSDGTIVGKFGSHGSKPGQLEHPHYIAVSNTNRVIVSDSNNHRIQIFDVNGRVLSTFGQEGSDNGQFKFPRGVAVDDQGYIVVGDSGNNRIQIFSPDGTFVRAFGCWGSGQAEFKGLEGVAVMSNQNILACDRENHRVQVF